MDDKVEAFVGPCRRFWRIKMPFLFAPVAQAVIPVRDTSDFFPVRRVYGAAKNYAPDIATCEEKKDLIRRFF